LAHPASPAVRREISNETLSAQTQQNASTASSNGQRCPHLCALHKVGRLAGDFGRAAMLSVSRSWPGTDLGEFSAGPKITYNYLMDDLITIQPATASDRPLLRGAIIELLDHESRLPGEQIAGTYLAWIERRAADSGAVLVAGTQDILVGFAAGWVEQDDNIAETSDSNRSGYISDICVMRAYRGQAHRASTARQPRTASSARRDHAPSHRLPCRKHSSACDL
jgi:hypothetical protein